MIVIIDNYDSFTYNLVQYFKLMENNVVVFRNNEVTIEELNEIDPTFIVLSPGPGTPKDSGICKDIINYFHQVTPILGVCLGHQIIVEFFGGNIIKGKQPMHGRVSTIEHNQLGVYEGIVSPTQVTRYHSLIASDRDLPSDLVVNARSTDGTIMGVRHQVYPLTGIQFHPESILTTDGFYMLQNCYNQALEWKKQRSKSGDDNETVSTI